MRGDAVGAHLETGFNAKAGNPPADSPNASMAGLAHPAAQRESTGGKSGRMGPINEG
jgi:hypothetical protein